jgi:hypothetical protein
MIIYVQFEFHQSVRKDIYLNKHERLSLFYFNFETFSQAIESSPMVFSGVPLSRSLVLCVEFLDHYLPFCYFSFVICIGCPSLIYGFRLSIWYLQTFFLYKHDLS